MFTFLDAARYHTHYQKTGKAGKSPPVVVIHGLMSTLNLWNYVRASLSKHYQVLAYDLLECGLSEKKGYITDGEVLPKMVEQLKDLLDSFEWQDATLIGASLGGPLRSLLPPNIQGASIVWSWQPQPVFRCPFLVVLNG